MTLSLVSTVYNDNWRKLCLIFIWCIRKIREARLSHKSRCRCCLLVLMFERSQRYVDSSRLLLSMIGIPFVHYPARQNFNSILMTSIKRNMVFIHCWTLEAEIWLGIRLLWLSQLEINVNNAVESEDAPVSAQRIAQNCFAIKVNWGEPPLPLSVLPYEVIAGSNLELFWKRCLHSDTLASLLLNRPSELWLWMPWSLCFLAEPILPVPCSSLCKV